MGEPSPERPREQDQALEEIRRLFARYREPRRFGRVAERDDPVEEREPEPAPPERRD
jgi:hypothetical protein